MPETEQFGSIIIGAGQGGVPLAMALARRGEKTALIERAWVGGTCINTGCTPAKTLLASAHAAHQVHLAADLGVFVDGVRVDLQVARRRKREVVASFRRSLELRLGATPNLELIRGHAAFAGERTVRVTDGGGERLLSADRIVIDTGCRPSIPPIPGLDGVPVLDNESLMEVGDLPEHLLIIGGGYIGVEFAQGYRRLGSRVTVLQRENQLLTHEDEDIAAEIAAMLRDDGVEVLLEAGVEDASPIGDGVRLNVMHQGARRELVGTHLLVAVGRDPNTGDLGLEAASIDTDHRGFVKVNDRLETSAEGVYAIGDVNGGPAFTHISYDDHRILLRNFFGDSKGSTKNRWVPYMVFTDPQLSSVGITEREAERYGLSVRTVKLAMNRVGRAIESGQTRGMMKAIVDARSERILGFCALCSHAGELAGTVQVAMMGGLPWTALRDAVFAHPTFLESLNILFSGLDEDPTTVMGPEKIRPSPRSSREAPRGAPQGTA